MPEDEERRGRRSSYRAVVVVAKVVGVGIYASKSFNFPLYTTIALRKGSTYIFSMHTRYTPQNLHTSITYVILLFLPFQTTKLIHTSHFFFFLLLPPTPFALGPEL